MDRKKTFNENPENYNKYRPSYTKELFKDIIKYAAIDKNTNVIEVGIGTGLATSNFLDTSCNLKAIELGSSLAEFSKEKFKHYTNFSIHNSSFEEYVGNENTIDLLYSATAFHWIDEEVAYKKVLDLLKVNGVIALFWNIPSPFDKTDLMSIDIEKIYKKYFDSKMPSEEDLNKRYERRSDVLKKYGFVDVNTKFYYSKREFTSDEYIGLLNTYSDHILLNEKTKSLFETEIKNTIDKHGGKILIKDTIDLHLARKSK